MFNIYYADCIGREGNCLYPHKADVTDAASLAQAVCHDYVCAEYKNSYRSNANFIRSNCLAVEFDNDHSENPEDWITPAKVKAELPGVEMAFHFSRHHMREKRGKPARPKFHMMAAIEPIFSDSEYAALKKRIAEANDVLDDRTATVRDIDIAQVRLLRAWRLLEPIDQAAEEADRILHEEINALAKELIDISEKVKPAVYTAASYKTLSTAIAKAKQLLADDTSTAQQLREARTQLLKARQALKKKSANTLKVKGKTVNLKAKKLKKKAQTVKRAKAVTVSKPRGTVKYTLSSVSKAKFKKYFKVNAKTGKITMKKGLKKGTYTVKIKVSAAGNGNYLPAAKTAKVIVKVK